MISVQQADIDGRTNLLGYSVALDVNDLSAAMTTTGEGKSLP